MSYLSELKNGKISASEFLAKSTNYLKRKLGASVSDEDVDDAVKAVDKMTDAVETAVHLYIKTSLPALPAAIAVSAATAVLNHIDAAIAGAGNVIKENN